MGVFERAKSVFAKAIKNDHNGIPGIKIFDSGHPGPTVGIVAMLHGNEPCGLAVYELLDENPGILEKGKVIFCLGNIFAAEKYFSTDDKNERLKFRSLNLNMNRIPEYVLTENDARLGDEAIRFRLILEELSTCDLVLDFHSTSLPGGRMLIPNEKWHLGQFIPVDRIIRNIYNLMRHKTLVGILGVREIPGAVVECGVHEELETWDFAKAVFLETLKNLSLKLKDSLQQSCKFIQQDDTPTQDHICVTHAIWFPSDNFTMTKNFENFEPVRAGQEIAVDPTSGEKVLSPVDGVILFPFPKGYEKGTSEEACFIGIEINHQGNS